MSKIENKGEGLLKNVAPRVLKSALWGFATFLMYYIAYQLFVLPILMFPELFSFQVQPIFFTFVALAVFFAVAIQFFSGTIIQHMLGVARSLILMTFLIYALKGGILTLTENVGTQTLTIMIDFRLFLMMIILVSLLGLAKSIIQTINFLASEKTSLSQDM
jgi:hypothetical protein